MGGLSSAVTIDEPRASSPAAPAGFAGIYRRHGRSLYGTALRLLGRPEDAEDAVQETFLKYYRGAPSIGEDRLESWLRRVVINDCLDRLRRRKRRPEHELPEHTPAPLLRHGGLALDLERGIARLPTRARQVFLLHDVEGFKHVQVAEFLSVTEGASKSQLHRARGILREHLKRSPVQEVRDEV